MRKKVIEEKLRRRFEKILRRVDKLKDEALRISSLLDQLSRIKEVETIPPDENQTSNQNLEASASAATETE